MNNMSYSGFMGTLRTQAALVEEVLGSQVGSYALSVEPDQLSLAARGELHFDREQARRLEALEQVILLLQKVDGNEVIRAWAVGLAPELGDKAPLSCLRDGDVQALLLSAQTFYANA